MLLQNLLSDFRPNATKQMAYTARRLSANEVIKMSSERSRNLNRKFALYKPGHSEHKSTSFSFLNYVHPMYIITKEH